MIEGRHHGTGCGRGRGRPLALAQGVCARGLHHRQDPDGVLRLRPGLAGDRGRRGLGAGYALHAAREDVVGEGDEEALVLYVVVVAERDDARPRARDAAGKIAQRRDRCRQSYVYSRWGGTRLEEVASFVPRRKAQRARRHEPK